MTANAVIFRPLFEPVSSTYTYLVACRETREAVLIDPVMPAWQRDTDFQSGDSRALYDSVRGRLFGLPGETLVYPAHDYHGRRVSSIAQER